MMLEHRSLLINKRPKLKSVLYSNNNTNVISMYPFRAYFILHFMQCGLYGLHQLRELVLLVLS